ncbi:hypothetical protein RR48_10989 [Papilio machaon]|uniref:Voltage-dependent calcium channel alpha-2/delta subunit conserved region domain-containing protein n=1 Tax=Papilio machaon TaxID=76193 RepID=A0A194RPC5_PAPMA|nr:hypothetical protein RR48_10989 [Papilio machaon]
MARISAEAIATAQWSEIDEDQDCSTCQLGSVIAFFASESGLTRWQYYEATSPHAVPPAGSAWSRGATEPWFKRAAAHAPALVIHAPLAPIRRLRNTGLPQPQVSEHQMWLTAARVLDYGSKGMLGVAGFHFYPRHLDDLLKTVTNIHCPEEDESKCEPRCDNKDWSCVLIDEEGWIVSKVREDLDDDIEIEPLRDHLANVHPAAMAALLNASVFKLHWIHDYQGVCFPPENEKIHAAAPSLPSILRSLWLSIRTIFHISSDLATVLFLLSTGKNVTAETEAEKMKRHRRVQKDFEREKYERLYDPRVLVNRTRFAACDRSRPIYQLQSLPSILRSLWLSIKTIFHISSDLATVLFLISTGKKVTAETEAEKMKRHRRVQKDFEREKYERLYDPRVLVNRTRFAACDRSRPIYQMQRTAKAMEALRRNAHACRWPLAAAPVPATNLILLAVYNACPHRGRPLNNPLTNERVEMADGRAGLEPSASRLACWRNRVPLPGRPPHVQCFPHNYSYEEGYRQCGPWLPDPENNARNPFISKVLIFLACVFSLI